MRLFGLLSWPYLRRHVLRWALTLSGIVLGVAVFIAMNTADRSIFHAFDQTVDQIAGATELQVTAGEFGFESRRSSSSRRFRKSALPSRSSSRSWTRRTRAKAA